jgi:hypothetical protein
MSKILGINKRCYPHEYEEPVEVTVVLVEGEIGYYAAYIGCGSPEWIARRGDKISFEEACVHFPGGQLKKELYRE